MRTAFGLVALLVGCYLALFHHLGARPLNVWDEARDGQNALEMIQSGDLLVTRSADRPDRWNTKPPLLVWMQAALLTTNLRPEIALGLPSAVAATLAMLVLVWYGRNRVADGTAIGFIAAFVLLSSIGFLGHHVGRTSDYDALLTLFVVPIFVWQAALHSTSKPLSRFKQRIMRGIDVDPFQQRLKAVHVAVPALVGPLMATVARDRFIDETPIFAGDTSTVLLDRIGHNTEASVPVIVAAFWPALQAAVGRNYRAAATRAPNVGGRVGCDIEVLASVGISVILAGRTT